MCAGWSSSRPSGNMFLYRPQQLGWSLVECLSEIERSGMEASLLAPVGRCGSGDTGCDGRRKSCRKSTDAGRLSNVRRGTIVGTQMRTALVHLSDIHLRSSGSPIIQAIDQLVSAVNSVDASISLFLVIISGDIANTGVSTEYQTALRFFRDFENKLRSVLRGGAAAAGTSLRRSCRKSCRWWSCSGCPG